ncbi:MAG: molybdopterin-dependent oxidoreductase, partial [Chloroflexota bacterium]|nr:molybdopterin-dependent oxidoreductase [Chloroflexota bacterium]
MNEHEISRRALLKGSAALAALLALGLPLEALEVEAASGEEVVPWLDQPPPFPAPPEETGVGTQLIWEEVGDRLSWTHKFFTVQHYGAWPVIREAGWRLAVDGLVRQPLSLTLAALRQRPRQEVIFTLECSGNHGFPFFTGGIGTAHWVGTPLAPLL